jgi:hypothetical protein
MTKSNREGLAGLREPGEFQHRERLPITREGHAQTIDNISLTGFETR